MQAMYDGGARVVEVTMTTPGALKAFSAIRSEFGDRLFAAAGTVLTAAAAHAAILAGARVIVSPPATVPEVIDTAKHTAWPVTQGLSRRPSALPLCAPEPIW